MLNNISSQNMDPNNIQAAWPLGRKDKTRIPPAIEAPTYLPKYSLTEALQAKDEFKKIITTHNHKVKNRKKHFKSFMKTVGFCLATVGTFCYFWKKY